MSWKCALLLVPYLLCSLTVFGQSVATPTVPTPLEMKRSPIPLDHLYRLFLESQVALDKSSAELQKQGHAREAAFRRQYRQTALHFTNAQMAAVRQAAQKAQQDKADLWAKAMPTILQDREWRKLNGPNAGHAPGHSQVDAWQKDNEAKLRQTIADLNRKLGPVAAAQLQSHITRSESPSLPSDHPLIHFPTSSSDPSGVQR